MVYFTINQLNFRAFSKLYHDPRGRPTVTAGSDHYFCTFCPSVLPHFSNLQKQQKIMVATCETVGLAEWIIDDTCLVSTHDY